MKTMVLVSGWGFEPAVFEPLLHHFEQHYVCETLNGNLLLAPGALEAELNRYQEPPIVAGWSMGGQLAIRAALATPEKMAALVLMSTTLKFCSDDLYLWGVPPANIRAMKLGLRKDLHNTLGQFVEQVCAPQSTDFLPEGVLHTDTDTLAAGLDFLAETDFREADFSACPPSIVYHGKKDGIISSNAGRMISQKMNSAHLMRYNGMGHAMPIEMPMILAANITFQLERLGV